MTASWLGDEPTLPLAGGGEALTSAAPLPLPLSGGDGAESEPRRAGAVPASPLEPPVQTRSEGDRLLRRIGEHEAALAARIAEAEEQQREIVDWLAGERRLHETAIAQLKARLQPYVDAEILANPLRRQSAVFPHGRAGYRAPVTRLQVDDAEGLVAWLEANHPRWLRVRCEPAVATIKQECVEGPDGAVRLAVGDGELLEVPGCRLVTGSEPVFFVSTGAGGRR